MYKKYKITKEDIIKEGIPNNSKVYYTGSVWETDYGECVILGKCNKYHKNNNKKNFMYYYIEFKNTGYITIACYSHIASGKVSNNLLLTVYDVGMLGDGPFSSKTHKKEYTTWHTMMQRCYSVVFQKRNPTYKDCTVDPRWHNFQNFCEDIQELEGYAEWKDNNKSKAYGLDKDIKSKGNKIYSKETCVFVSTKINSTEAVTRKTEQRRHNKCYIGHRLSDGYEEEFGVQKEFAKKYHLNHSHLCSCLTGHLDKHRGWTFKIKEEKNN